MAKLTHPADRKPKESRHKVRTLTAPEYNPEAELSEKTLSAHDHYKRMAIEAKAFHRGAIRVSGRFAVVTAYKDGKMAEANPGKKGGWKLSFNGTKEAKRHTITDKGIRYIVETRRIFSNAQFEKMTETKEWATSKMIETSGVNSFDFGNDDITTGSIVGPPNDEYIPLLGGPFSKQLYLYDYLDMHAKCLAADTRIPLLDGTTPTIKELSQREGSYWVYSSKDGKVVPGRAFNARQTGIREVLKLTFDNGMTLRCTADHPIMLRSGQFKDAGFLVPGESLMPLYRRSTRDYERVYHPNLDWWEQTHHMVMRESNSAEFLAKRDTMANKMVIDHINENHTDNRPENLQMMSRTENVTKASRTDEHRQRSRDQIKKAWAEQGESMARKISDAKKKFWANMTPEQKSDYVKKMADGQKKAWKEGSYKDRKPKGIVVNHKVVSIEKAGYEEVYDLSVDEHHNFAIESGIFVHNCFWAKNHHPFAKAIVNTLRAYIIGKGTKVLFKDSDRQDRWDAFEKRVNWQDKLRTDTETLIWAGEIMTEKIKDADGLPSIAQIDPSTVWEIVTDPLTPEVALYFHQQYPTQWQLTYHASDKSTEYIINDIPGDDVIHVKINTAPGEKRGRSDLFAILSWLKRFRDYFNAKVVKAQMEESWALDIAIDGSQADVDAVAGNNAVTRIPPAGSTRVHNKDVVYEYLQPTSSSNQGRDDVGEQLKNVIAVGGGIAPEWLGESAAGSTKETARTKEGPAARNIEDKQMVIERYIRQVVEFVMETEIEAGNVKEASEDTFEIIFPEGSTDDRTAKIDDIIKAETSRFISHERAATMVAKELAITSFDAKEEKNDIQGEQDEGDGNPEWAGAMPPKPNGNGAAAGAPPKAAK